MRTAITSLRALASVVAVVLLAAGMAGPVHADQKLDKHFAVIYGTVLGPDGRRFYGAKVRIHLADKKDPHWELYSDHAGEFAQRVPPGPDDYVVTAEAEVEMTAPGQKKKKAHLHGEAKVHVEPDLRVDVGVHLTE